MQIIVEARPDNTCKRLKTEYRAGTRIMPIWTITDWRTPSGMRFTTVHHVSAGLIHIWHPADLDVQP